MKDVPDYVNALVLPRYELLIKFESENTIKGGFIAGQRTRVFVMDADSNEDLCKKLRFIPFWGWLNGK